MKRKTERRAREADYAIVVEPLSDHNGRGWLASVPALPGCYGDGETRAEALEDALAAIDEWKDAAPRLGREIPGSGALGQWRQRVPKTLHDKSLAEVPDSQYPSATRPFEQHFDTSCGASTSGQNCVRF